MRRIIITTFAAIFAASTAYAEVDCSIVDRIERVHTSLQYLRGDPFAQTAASNIKGLQQDLNALDGNKVRTALSDHTNTDEIGELVAFINVAQDSKSQIQSMTAPQFAQSLRGTTWDVVMPKISNILSHMPCGHSTSENQGDNEGREVDTETLKDGARIKLNKTTSEDLIEAVIFSILGIAAVTFAGHRFVKWLRYQAVLKKRRSKRFAAKIACHLSVGKKVFEAEIIDISCHGAKIKYWHGEQINTADKAGVNINATWHMGSHAWSNQHYYGIKFHTPLPIPLVRALAQDTTIDGLGQPAKDTKKAAIV